MLMHSIVRYVPAWFPGMGLKRHALKTREVVDQVIEGPFSETKNRKVSGIITHGKLTSYDSDFRQLAGETFPSMVSDLLYEKEDTTNEEHENTLKKAALAVFNGPYSSHRY